MTGAQDDSGPLRSVVVKHARDAFVSPEAIEREWRELGYGAPPDLARAAEESDGFVALLEGAGAEVHLLPSADGVGLDSLYPRDAAVMCDRGAILCRMGKPARAGEPAALEVFLSRLGVPIHGRIEVPGLLEGGDVAWLDACTVAVGRGYRTNEEGIRQLRALLADAVDEVVVVPLPHWRGPGGVFHLMSMFSPLDRDLALVYAPLLPVPFRELLLGRGIELIEVPDEEFESLGTNALALAPRVCALVAGNPVTRRRLEAAGVAVSEFEGRETCRKGKGGPTCLTRPLARGVPDASGT